MAQLSLAANLTLQSAVDATTSSPSGGTTLPTFTSSNSTSIQRVEQSVINNDYNWQDIQLFLETPPQSTFENQRTITDSVSRIGRRPISGILYPRGTYTGYRRNYTRRVF